MKKALSLVLLSLLLLTTSASALTAFPAFDDFELEFEYAAILTGSGHYITSNNLSVEDGSYSKVYTVSFDDTLSMLVSVPHETGEISEAMMLYASDGTTLSALNFIYGIGELAMATGAIDAVEEIWDFLGLLGLLDHMEDGDSNSIIIGQLEYSYMAYTSLGIFFYVTIVE
ncbi:MAG TPA: hypothetical protein PKU80_02820 [Candidatus Limiplasma sp.]|nr:hypothetical protein [Candidatus Limiplasma sp.]HRX08117.1 hypothetical protein [Candidatus Limiplasma sp.]